MVCQKFEYNKFFSLKFWLFAFYKIYIKKGYKLKAFHWLKLFIIRLKYIIIEDLNSFFNKLNNKLTLRVTFLKRVVAGKIVKIPYFMQKQKKIWFYVKFILKSLKERTEKTFLDKLIHELIDITKNTGITIKKYLEFQNEIKIVLPNMRFIKN